MDQRTTWNHITNPTFPIHSFVITPDPYLPYHLYVSMPNGNLFYGFAITPNFYNSPSVYSSPNGGSRNFESHISEHNRYRPIQERGQDLQYPMVTAEAVWGSFEVSLTRSAYTSYTQESSFNWDSVETQSHSNLQPQVLFSQDDLSAEVLSDDEDIYREVGIVWIDGEAMIFELDQDDEDMTYERLLRLEEEMGRVSTGLSEETISKHLKIRTQDFPENVTDLNKPPDMEEPEICVVCQSEYERNDTIGTLECGHEYHEGCIKKWLLQKNVCPICKGTALSMEKKR